MSRTQFRHIRDDVYGIDLLIVWGGSIDHAQEIAEHLFGIRNELAIAPGDVGAMFDCDVARNCSVYVIWLREKNIGTIAHECIHLVADIFKKRGILFNASNDEQIAYYIGFWIDAILQPKRRDRRA